MDAQGLRRARSTAGPVIATGLAKLLPRHRIDHHLSPCPIGWLETLDELAGSPVFVVSDENSVMTGARLMFDGGL